MELRAALVARDELFRYVISFQNVPSDEDAPKRGEILFRYFKNNPTRRYALCGLSRPVNYC